MRTRLAHRIIVPGFVLAASPQLGAQRGPTIDNPAPNPAAPSFRVVPEPILRIGGLNDDERYELLGVMDAELTSTGGLVVAPQARSQCVRWWSVGIEPAAASSRGRPLDSANGAP